MSEGEPSKLEDFTVGTEVILKSKWPQFGGGEDFPLGCRGVVTGPPPLSDCNLVRVLLRGVTGERQFYLSIRRLQIAQPALCNPMQSRRRKLKL